MVVIEVPKVDVLAVGEGLLSDIPSTLHYLLSRLLEQDDALLHAERRPTQQEATFFLRRRGDGREGDDVPVATLPAGVFSSIVSRVALALDIDYTGGGHARGVLAQGGWRHECRVFLSKCRESGYWIRIYVRPEPARGAAGATAGR
jgi:hypothetical protein